MKTRFIWIMLFCLVLFSAIPAAAKDTWINVCSKNFFLVGNASEKEIRGVATKLEQFRETFRQVFPRAKFNNSIQTNVLVFKSASSYKPFKPKRADGKADEWVAGYFQAGEDVNYITLSTEGEKEDTYGTIFHEYVHYLLRNNLGDSNIPPWFNEGLAEYYQTFQIRDDIKATLGNVQVEHLQILQRTQLIPLKTLFAIDYYQLYQNGNHSRTIFYAQSWALMHYLIQGNKGANLGSLDKFLTLLRSKAAPEQAFQQAFGYDYATMEAALKKYVAQRTFMATLVTFPQKLVFDTEMTAVPVSDTEANAYLGDLLYHTGEYIDAETYLKNALALDANSAMANTSLGLVKMRQRKFDEAKKYLETAIAGGQKNHIAHYNYAYVLSRESMDEFGYVTSFPADKAKKMRDSLFRAIELNPNFSESYSLLAFIGMVNNENLDEAVAYLKKGLAVEPGNQEYVLQMAEIYLRQQKFREAKEIAENLVRTAAEPEIHTRAEGVLRSLSQYEEAMAHNEALRKQYESGAGRPGRPALKERKTLSDAEIKKLQEDSVIDSLNRLLQKPKEGEKQAVGYVQKITCAGGAVTYSVKTESESLTLTSKDFASLDLLAVTPEAETLALGCSAKIQDILTVIVYRPGKDAKAKNTLLALAFVPKNFKLRTAEEMAKNDALINESMGNDEDAQSYTETVISGPAESTGPSGEAFPTDEDRRAAILKRIGDSLRKPQADEKRVMGILEKIECVKDKMIFYVKAETQTLRLRAASLQDIKLNLFTNEISGVQIGCGKKPEPVLSVITFRPDNNPKAKENGEIVAVEYVPRTFKLP